LNHVIKTKLISKATNDVFEGVNSVPIIFKSNFKSILEASNGDHATLLSTWWYFEKAVSPLRPITRSAVHTVLFPRHKKVPISNVRALFQTDREKSIANGLKIDKMAGDSYGITSWICFQNANLAAIFHSYQIFMKFSAYNLDFLSARLNALSTPGLKTSKLYKVEFKKNNELNLTLRSLH
jgi:hypothetical protein